MNILSLFTSFSGRISRLQWWFGIVVLSIAPAVLAMAAMIVIFLANAILGPSVAGPIVGVTVFAVVIAPVLLFVPWMAVVFKRLQDRDWPAWVGPTVAVLLLPGFLSNLLIFWNLKGVQFHGAAAALLVAYMLVVLALIVALVVDNGFLRGTKGPNRHGPDPEAESAELFPA